MPGLFNPVIRVERVCCHIFNCLIRYFIGSDGAAFHSGCDGGEFPVIKLVITSVVWIMIMFLLILYQISYMDHNLDMVGSLLSPIWMVALAYNRHLQHRWQYGICLYVRRNIKYFLFMQTYININHKQILPTKHFSFYKLCDWSRAWPTFTWLANLVGVSVSSSVPNTNFPYALKLWNSWTSVG